MGRSPCCDENGLKKGPWTSEEDELLINYINKHGHGSWRALPNLAGLRRCGKSCRLRWTNYLRPDIKRGKFTDEEEQIIINLHGVLGNKWSAIATHLPGRTDNEIKNFWNTHLRKKLLHMGIDPTTHMPRTDQLNLLQNLPQLLATCLSNNLINPWDTPWDNAMASIQTDSATQLTKFQLMQNILQALNPNPPPSIELLNLLGALPTSEKNQQIFGNSNINSLSYPHEGLGNNFFNTGPNDLQYTSSFSNLNSNETTGQNIQPLLNSKPFSGAQVNGNYNQLRECSLPSLVPFSPERSTVNQTENKNHLKNDQVSIPSSATSTTFEANWGELMGDEAGDSYWNEMLDQATTPSWRGTDHDTKGVEVWSTEADYSSFWSLI